MNLRNKPYAEGTRYRHARRVSPPKKQNGVVLFVALIALVVMSLAAVALIRSVDTNTMIAGNLAFKQAAISSADSGLETAMAALIFKAGGGETAFDNDDTAVGYYSTSVADAKTLANASTALATVIDPIAPGTDSSGNTIRYVVQRMCRTTGAGSPANCLFGAPPETSGSKAVKDATGAGGPGAAGNSVMFRVTVSVAGPKNTLAYTQAYVY